MFIKEIIIEGFKSYATRTVIKGFDPQFNAITGLNGSGKSNILDAILFVLGLTQLSLARVNNLQELIYKFGHAGVTKAIVTLILDNSDRKNSPTGYEEFETINITRQISQGKSKYFLNGHSETTTKIKNLFKSVQLNIDNPHFLVAQGRITKIINLKPSELISMLEETAGTSLYNDKKKESRKIMEKKEEKLREINDLLKREIEPQMDKLRREKETYLLWKSGELELNRLNKILSAFEYFSKNKILQNLFQEINEIKSIDAEIKLNRDTLSNEMSRVEKKIHSYETEKRENKITGENKTSLDEKFNEKQKQLIQIESEMKNMMRSLDNFEKDQVTVESQKKENNAKLAKLIQMIDFSNVTLKEYENALKDKKSQYEEAKRNLQAAKSGGNLEEAGEALNKQLEQAEKKYQENQNHINRLRQKIGQIKEQLEVEKSAVESSLNNRKNESKTLEILQNEIEKLDEDINSFESTGDLNVLCEQKRRIDEEIMRANHALSNITEKNFQFQLKYRDPEPNFDRRKVKGKVFQLISVVENKYIRALEQAAGGRIYNIVVDNENTAKLLMKKECFSYHVNLIPNNKIQGQPISENIISMAGNLAHSMGGFALPAYRLVTFDKELTNTMEYVFGNTFICSNSEIAKKIAFHQEIRKRCVNLDGDIFDPNGTLTGGYVNPNDSILTRNEEYKKISQQIEEMRKEQRGYDERIAHLRKDQDYLSNLKSELEAKTLKLNLIKEKMKRNSSVRMQDKHTSLENDLLVFQEQIEKLIEIEKKYSKEIEDLKQEKTGFFNNTSKDSKDIWKDKTKKLESELGRLNEEVNNLKKQIYKSEVERESVEAELKKLDSDFKKGEKGYEDLKEGYIEKKKLLVTIRKEFDILMEEKRRFEEKILSVDTKLSSLIDEREKIKRKLDNIEKDSKKNEGNLNKNLKESRDLQETLKNLEKTFPFLINEKDFFGVPNTEYDFEDFDINEKEKKYFQMRQEQQNLQKRVNLKVEAMSDKVEKEFKDLIEKRVILEQDKVTLNVNMEELDKKKREALEKCYLSVNEHFGKIFSTLLPGTFAKIQQFAGKDLSDGLEIGVSFNNVWKTSLSELSGGQRSLLALSFILSLLLYKPAPFYILDEIDAALDLSHTENIGAMISQHFSQSQFLIISLKDGMFNNANVLFKTSFVDGLSKVDRMVLKNKDKKKQQGDFEEKENQNLQKDKKNRMLIEGN